MGIDLLLHFGFELTIDHDLFLAAHLWIEQLDCDVPALKLETPDILFLRPTHASKKLRQNLQKPNKKAYLQPDCKGQCRRNLAYDILKEQTECDC